MIAAELLRFWSRRLVRWMTLFAILGLLLTGFLSFINTDDATSQPDGAVVTLSPAYEDCVATDGFGQFQSGDPQVEDFCLSATGEFGFQDSRFFATDMQDIFIGTSVPIALLAFFLGASGMGAEWLKGTMTTTLTWEPRRGVVFAAKLAASLIGAAILYVLLQGLLTLVLLPSILMHGTTEGVNAEWWRGTVEVLFRGGAIGLIAASVGMSLAAIGRNTAAALGVGFGYMIVIENLVRALKPAWQPWLVGDNLGAFITDDSLGFPLMTHSPESAGLIVLGYAAAVALIAFVMFRTRDVS